MTAQTGRAPRGLLWVLVVGTTAGLLILAGLLRFIGIYEVSSPSMAPGIAVGDRILVDKTAYRARPPRRGDVIAFRVQGLTPPGIWIKRAIGLPGDRIEIRDAVVLINGVLLRHEQAGEVSFDDAGLPEHRPVALPERALFEEWLDGRHWQIAQLREGHSRSGTWTVPAGQLFVLGDNRDASADSRDDRLGMVPLSSVVGRVCRTIYSTGPDGLRPRWWRKVL